MDWLCLTPADASAFYLGIGLIVLGGTVATCWEGRFAYALAMALTVPGVMIVAEAKAEATVENGYCAGLREQGWPCWMLQILFCKCDGDGGGSGAGDVPIPQ